MARKKGIAPWRLGVAQVEVVTRELSVRSVYALSVCLDEAGGRKGEICESDLQCALQVRLRLSAVTGRGAQQRSRKASCGDVVAGERKGGDIEGRGGDSEAQSMPEMPSER